MRRQGVKDLPTAIVVADRLVDFKAIGAPESDQKKKDTCKGKYKDKATKGWNEKTRPMRGMLVLRRSPHPNVMLEIKGGVVSYAVATTA